MGQRVDCARAVLRSQRGGDANEQPVRLCTGETHSPNHSSLHGAGVRCSFFEETLFMSHGRVRKALPWAPGAEVILC